MVKIFMLKLIILLYSVILFSPIANSSNETLCLYSLNTFKADSMRRISWYKKNMAPLDNFMSKLKMQMNEKLQINIIDMLFDIHEAGGLIINKKITFSQLRRKHMKSKILLNFLQNQKIVKTTTQTDNYWLGIKDLMKKEVLGISGFEDPNDSHALIVSKLALKRYHEYLATNPSIQFRSSHEHPGLLISDHLKIYEKGNFENNDAYFNKILEAYQKCLK